MSRQCLAFCRRTEREFAGDQQPVGLVMLPELPRPGIKYPVAEADKVAGCNPHDRETQFHGFHCGLDSVLRVSHLGIDVDLCHFTLQLFIR